MNPVLGRPLTAQDTFRQDLPAPSGFTLDKRPFTQFAQKFNPPSFTSYHKKSITRARVQKAREERQFDPLVIPQDLDPLPADSTGPGPVRRKSVISYLRKRPSTSATATASSTPSSSRSSFPGSTPTTVTPNPKATSSATQKTSSFTIPADIFDSPPSLTPSRNDIPPPYPGLEAGLPLTNLGERNDEKFRRANLSNFSVGVGGIHSIPHSEPVCSPYHCEKP